MIHWCSLCVRFGPMSFSVLPHLISTPAMMQVILYLHFTNEKTNAKKG